MPNKTAKNRKHEKVKRTKENKARKKAKRVEIQTIKRENAELKELVGDDINLAKEIIRIKEQLASCKRELKEATE